MATVYTWTDSVTEITWNYVTSGSDAIIGEDTGNFNASATTSGIGLNGNIIIPSTVIDSNNVSYTVTRIGKRAFAGASFQSITIPDTVTEISQQGISGCNGLTTVTFGNNSQCTTFGETAFYACANLVSITLPNSLESIGQACFQNCSKIPSITIPASVTTFAGNAFAHCALLDTVVFEEGIQLTSIESGTFQNCTALTSINIPDLVTTIGIICFKNCTDLTSINIPDSVTTIGAGAFQDCSGLTSINIPDLVTTIGNNTFKVCSGLTSVTIPDLVTTIGIGAFQDCSGLTSINIPDSVTTIDTTAFSGTSANLEVTMNTKTIDGTTYTSPTPTDEDISFFGNDSVTLFLPPLTMTIASTTTGVTSGSTTYNPSIALTFTSSKATIDFVVGDITVTNGTLSAFAGSGTGYTATFTPTGQGACTIDISAGVYTDAATNLNNLATQFTWTFDLAAGGLSIAELIAGGVTIPQLFAAGVIPDWTLDTDANHLAQSYVKDFIDISGSLVLRENSNLTVNGNIETKGNITIKNQIMAADLSLNHNIFVGGDISMNGNVTVGDVSMNGKVVDCSFTDSSIPASAFIGTMPGPDYTQPTILYEKGFDTTDDVSMNANVQINNLKVDGNIEFSDGTTMDTFDDNKSVSYGAQLLESNLTISHASTYTNASVPMRCSADGKYSIVHFGDAISSNPNSSGTTADKSAILLSSDYGETYNAITLPTMPVISSTYNNLTSITGDNDFTKVDFKCMGISPSGKNIIIGISGTDSLINNWTNTSLAWSLDYGATWETHYVKEILGDAITGQQSSWVMVPNACAIDDAGKIAVATDKSNQYTQSYGKGIFYSVDRTSGSFMYTSLYPGKTYSLDITNNEIAFATQGVFYKLTFTGVIRTVSVPSINNNYYKYSVSQYVGNDGICAIFTLGWQSNGSLISPCYFIKDDGTTLTAIDKSTTIQGLFTDSTKYNRMASAMSASGKYIMIGGCDGFLESIEENVNIRETGFQVYYSEDYGATFNMKTFGLQPEMPVSYVKNIVITDNSYIYAKYATRDTGRLKFSLFKASTFTSLNIVGNLTAGSLPTSSDYRIKTDVSQLDEKVTLDNLRPVKYLQTILNKPQYGLIAHELQEYYPDLVVGEKDGKEWQRVNYTGLIALLINEIKQLKRDLVELENGM